ncbi:ornithine carbamoyltransferase [Candidatus Woesearchaeota archaeon]|nr:ornithine carbamoyltransferase [Candidatus Woesearchaeota archaeon]
MHLLSLEDFGPKVLNDVLILSADIKKNPARYSNALKGKTLLMFFEKPSLRTRLSFEVAMTQLGGHAIFYSIKDSPLGKKETIGDTAKCASRYVNIIMARLLKSSDMKAFAEASDVPCINALDNLEHPCQIIADLLTIKEKKGKLKGLKLAYVGDCNNNVTNSLMLGCAMTGMDISVAGPDSSETMINENVFKRAKKYAKDSGVSVEKTAEAAVKGADVVYTDSWMSYHIAEEQKKERIKLLMPFQVNSKLMKHAKNDAIFMNCLPALRGMEQTAEVIDGKQSVVFDQAENRLHTEKAILIKLLEN